MKLSLGFSPCPNDTFIFDALVNKKIDSEGLEFDVFLEDVETLNQWALQCKLDVTKLSFPAFFKSLDHYLLVDAGSALGKGVGPLLISKSGIEGQGREVSTGALLRVNEMTIALPGINTTANLLFSFAFSEAKYKKFMLFSAIENAVSTGETELGVIIHENRFTYQQKGLYKILDLGEYWEEKMQVPIPLGGIAINRSIKKSIACKVNELIRKSIEYAFQHYPFVSDFVKQHAQEMSEDIMRQHIDLYVNNFSLSLGSEGRKAIEKLFEVFNKMNKTETDNRNFNLFL